MALFLNKKPMMQKAAKLCPECRKPMERLCEGSMFMHCDGCNLDIEESYYRSHL